MTKPNPKYSHVVITGASSGIGAALALALAEPGVLLSLTGRNSTRLEAVAGQCRMRGATVETGLVDVTDRQRLSEWLCARDDSCPVDLLIANAGISGGTGDVMNGEDPAQARRIFDVNVTGVLNTVEPLLGRMISRGRGQVALMSSLAGFVGWPGAPAYCASKAAVRVYGEGLRASLARTGVKVNVICPGFVRSPMTDANDFSMPMIMPAARAAEIVVRGLHKNRGRIAFPIPVYLFVLLLAALPQSLAQILLKKTPAKTPLI